MCPEERKGSGFTPLLAALIMVLVREMPVNAVTRPVGEHETRIWQMLRHHVGEVRRLIFGTEGEDRNPLATCVDDLKAHIKELKALNLHTMEAYQMKLLLQDIFEQNNRRAEGVSLND